MVMALAAAIQRHGPTVHTVVWTVSEVRRALKDLVGVDVNLYLDPASDADARDLILSALAGGVVGGIGGVLTGCAVATRVAGGAAHLGWWVPGPGWVVAALGVGGLAVGAVGTAVACRLGVRVRLVSTPDSADLRLLAKRSGDNVRLAFERMGVAS